MIWMDALLALVLAGLFAVLAGAVIGSRGPWSTPWALFLVLFLFIWAGGAWAAPVGPPFMGVYWAPFLLMGFFVMLLFAAIPSGPPRTTREAMAEARAEDEVTGVGLTIFFWLLVGALTLAILIHYL
jgi:hypothetical protein